MGKEKSCCRIDKTCCCCCSVETGTVIIGVLDIIAAIGSLIQCIIVGANGKAGASFFSGSKIWITITSLLICKISRAGVFIFLLRNRQDQKRRHLYFLIRLITFLIQFALSIIDLVTMAAYFWQ
jgi:hypothetical protein